MSQTNKSGMLLSLRTAADQLKKHHLAAPTVSLVLITLVVSLLLSGANALTSARIETMRADETTRALMLVAPGADKFSELAYETEDIHVVGLTAAYREDTLVGYCVEVAPVGFGGAIDMIVGVDLSGEVTGVHILSQSETPGLGTKAQDEAFLDQYVGKSGTIKLNAGTNSIQAISGATVTSSAVTKGVNEALALVSSLG